MFTRPVVALSLVGLLAGTGVALAEQDAQRPAAHAHGMARLQQHLGLTDEQVTAIKTAYERHWEERKQAWQALGAAQADLRQAALSNADTSAKMGEVQRLMGQTITLRVQVLQEIGSVLTPEQRAKFAQIDFHRGMRHHRGPSVQS